MEDNSEIIPIHKLDREIQVPLTELEGYKIYSGFEGRDLQLVNGRCLRWFKSLDPRYIDYLFQIPRGRPRPDPLGDWRIRITKKDNLMPPSIDMYTEHENGFIQRHLRSISSNNDAYRSIHPELAEYTYLKTRHVQHNRSITTFTRMLSSQWAHEQEMMMRHLFDWVSTNVGNTLRLPHYEISRLKIWAGVDGSFLGTPRSNFLLSHLPILGQFYFSVNRNGSDYELTINLLDPPPPGPAPPAFQQNNGRR
jgi:hypothetical protein